MQIFDDQGKGVPQTTNTFQLVPSDFGKYALRGNVITFDGCRLPKRGGLKVRVRRHLALAGVARQLMDISAGIRCWPTTLSY